MGFTCSTGPLYNPDGTPVAEVQTALSTFDTSTGTTGLKSLCSTVDSTLSLSVATLSTTTESLILGGSGSTSITDADRTARATTATPYIDPTLNQ